MKIKKIILAFCCVLLLTSSALAGDTEWLFTHNAHDSLIIGEVSDISNGIATIKVAHHIVSKLPDGVKRAQLSPDEIKIKADYTCFGFINENVHENKVGDDVMMSLRKDGESWQLGDACYLVDSTDYKSLNILIPPMEESDIKNTAAVHSLLIKSFANSDGTAVDDLTSYTNAHVR